MSYYQADEVYLDILIKLVHQKLSDTSNFTLLFTKLHSTGSIW